MKKKTFLSILAILVLFMGIIVFSCKKSSSEDPNLTYIKDFYGVNVVHSFVIPSQTNDTKSVQVDMVWNDKGVASYTTKDIPRDSSKELTQILFVPADGIDTIDHTAAPPRIGIKRLTLAFINNVPEPVDWTSCPCYCWKCAFGADATYSYTTHSWYCTGTPGQPAPAAPHLELCQGGNSAPWENTITVYSY